MKRVPFLLLTLFGLTTCTARDSGVGPVSEELNPSFATISYDCTAQTQTPFVECEALVAFYNSTNGPEWTNNTDWLATNTPCSWYGVGCNVGGRVTTILMIGNALSGPLPPELGDLSALTGLNLNDNQLTGPILPELGDLTNLSGLSLWGNQLTGPIPPELGNLTSLRSLQLNWNDLTGPIPPELGNLSGLRNLRLQGNQLIGQIPLGVAVIGGRIDDAYFVGTSSFCYLGQPLPAGVYWPDTPEYRAADLDGDGEICGITIGDGAPSIPPPIIADAILVISNRVDGLGDGSDGNTSYFVELQHLLVEGNVSGLEPDDVTVSVNGSALSVAWRHFEVAPEGGNTRVIVWSPLDAPPPLGEYSVTVRDQYGQTSNPFVITDLEDLPRDAPDILLPEHLSTITNPQPTFEWQPFKSQYLGQQLDTEAYGLQLIPSSGQLFGVWPMPADQTSLSFENDGWTPSQPPELAPGAHVVNVSAFRAISGRLHFEHTRWIDFVVTEPSCATQNEIPIQECEALVALYNSTNGPGWMNNEGWLDYTSPCRWYGVTCFGVEARGVVIIDLHENELSGTIPLEVGNLEALDWLYLNGNQLAGEIPPELGNLTNLSRLFLSNNQLTGEIPVELGNLSELRELLLHHNQLTGTVPSWLGTLPELRELWLRGNQLEGEIPAGLGNLRYLYEVGLDGNKLTGAIPAELGNLVDLRLLFLSNNRLTGSIPPQLGNLSRLEQIDLHYNQLTGMIPAELGNLVNLDFLSLGFNQLTGPIPPELGNLSNLGWLWLGSNQLIGPIPPELGNLSNLRVLWLERNQLGGLVPLSLAQLGGVIQMDEEPDWCLFVPPGNEDLYIPDTEAYRLADLSGLGAICGVPFTNNAETVTEDLTAEVEDLVTETVLNAGQAGALTSKLDNALAIVAGGQSTLGVSSLAVDATRKVKDTNYKVAINLVNAFRNQVNDFVATGVLTPEEAAPLLERAAILIELWSNK